MTSDAATEDGATLLLAELGGFPRAYWTPTLRTIGARRVRRLLAHWPVRAHGGQTAPADWRVWLIRAGRGFGKTRAGAEWVSALARADGNARIALVAATLDEARRVMVEGDSGVLACAQDGERPRWVRSRGLVEFASGAQAQIYSASAPESLRGPQHHAAWCDEIAKWNHGVDTWNNLLLGLRLGERPRAVVTTTPRPNAVMRRVMGERGLFMTGGRTRDNAHLSAEWRAAMEAEFGGTRLGAQELDGEMVEDGTGVLWTRKLLDGCRVDAAPALDRVVVAVDPPASAGGDACGIVAVGLGRDGRGYVLEDATVSGRSPEGWAHAVAACAARHAADRVVAEANQGGEMVETVLRIADHALPVRLVHASRGKGARAEPVHLLYERGRVRHAGRFPELEAELAGMRLAGGYEGPGRSPDRADACVWGLWALLVDTPGEVRVRSL